MEFVFLPTRFSHDLHKTTEILADNKSWDPAGRLAALFRYSSVFIGCVGSGSKIQTVSVFELIFSSFNSVSSASRSSTTSKTTLNAAVVYFVKRPMLRGCPRHYSRHLRCLPRALHGGTGIRQHPECALRSNIWVSRGHAFRVRFTALSAPPAPCRWDSNPQLAKPRSAWLQAGGFETINSLRKSQKLFAYMALRWEPREFWLA